MRNYPSTPRRGLQDIWRRHEASEEEAHLVGAVVAWAAVQRANSSAVIAVAKVSRAAHLTFVEEVAADAHPGRPAARRGLARVALLYLVGY